MKRKFGGLLLALCMALCLLPSAAFAADGAACPRCGRTVSATEGDFDVKMSDMNTNHYQAYRCSGCACTFLANQALPHRGGTATCTEKARCEDCNWRYGATVGPDKVCRTQDYTFTFAVPEGCTQPGCGYEFPMMGDEADVQVEGSIATGTVKADWYDKTEDSFVVLASVLTADGYFVTASKTVTIVDGHEGGEATCTQGAVCAVCGEVYSEPDPMNHAAMRHVDAKAATVTDEGNIEYWTCADCGRYFLDEAGEKEIGETDIVLEKLPEQPQPEESKPEEPKPDDKTPRTGDDGVAMWMALAGVAIGAAGVLVIGKKKSETT